MQIFIGSCLFFYCLKYFAICEINAKSHSNMLNKIQEIFLKALFAKKPTYNYQSTFAKHYFLKKTLVLLFH